MIKISTREEATTTFRVMDMMMGLEEAPEITIAKTIAKIVVTTNNMDLVFRRGDWVFQVTLPEVAFDSLVESTLSEGYANLIRAQIARLRDRRCWG